MEALLYLIWFTISFPALPFIGLWSLAWGPSHGTSGQLGLFFVSSFVGGILLWTLLLAFLFFGGSIPYPHITMEWT